MPGHLRRRDAYYANRPWQCLNFLPEPQGQASLRPTRPQVDGSFGSRLGEAASAAGASVASRAISASE